ncbi:hypothetical protein I4U23_011377 [Adineta vaga]|nr:hypothetical protein I4U23_011377 [Adineta vaga]
MKKLRIGIIGAGPCGPSQLLAFKQAEEEQQVELICFERQSDWGGLWVYTSQIGIDVHGEPIHSSMYRHLWANTPKEFVEFPDYTFYDHFGCYLPSFLPRSLMYDYITGRAKANNLRRFIRFNTAVRLTELNEFPGRVLHAHDFRGADEFVDRNVLLVGSGWSAEDIAVQCYKFNARSVTISSRQELVAYKWPNRNKTAPILIRMEGRKAHFKDGSTIDNIDAIIFCTGYRHHYPFMAKRFRLESGITQFVPSTLYKTLVRDVFLGHVQLPDKDQWQADINKWQTRENSLGPVDFFGWVWNEGLGVSVGTTFV